MIVSDHWLNQTSTDFFESPKYAKTEIHAKNRPIGRFLSGCMHSCLIEEQNQPVPFLSNPCCTVLNWASYNKQRAASRLQTGSYPNPAQGHQSARPLNDWLFWLFIVVRPVAFTVTVRGHLLLHSNATCLLACSAGIPCSCLCLEKACSNRFKDDWRRRSSLNVCSRCVLVVASDLMFYILVILKRKEKKEKKR